MLKSLASLRERQIYAVLIIQKFGLTFLTENSHVAKVIKSNQLGKQEHDKKRNDKRIAKELLVIINYTILYRNLAFKKLAR